MFLQIVDSVTEPYKLPIFSSSFIWFLLACLFKCYKYGSFISCWFFEHKFMYNPINCQDFQKYFVKVMLKVFNLELHYGEFILLQWMWWLVLPSDLMGIWSKRSLDHSYMRLVSFGIFMYMSLENMINWLILQIYRNWSVGWYSFQK